MNVHEYLTIAVRAFTERADDVSESPTRQRRKRRRVARWPHTVLILDTESTTDPTQRFTFGSYRCCDWTDDGQLDCVDEGLIYADDLPERDPDGYAILTAYARMHDLRCYSRRAFVEEVFYPVAYRARALVAAFNFPFDISRVAIGWGAARGRFAGGFSFPIWEYFDKTTDMYREHPFRPRIAVKHMDPKRDLKGFTRPAKVDTVDLIPEGATDGQPDDSYTFRGHFLDLRTLIFALTDKGHSLASACAAFGVPTEESKREVEIHGVITPDYIDYNRQDVRATQALLERVRAEYDQHPIDLQATVAYSPASIAKAYLRAMGVRPILARQPDFPREVIGYALNAYFGGRAECHIRNTPVPVVYADFLSMYATVNANMHLWRFITAERIDVVDATEAVREFLANITLDTCFDPATWRDLCFFAEIEPGGDVVPLRANYSGAPGDLTIGVNIPTDAPLLWYAGPDLVASTLLAGKPPRIRHAFRLVPNGVQSGLNPVLLRGSIPVDPTTDDFFRTVIEERKRVDPDDWLNKFLKVLANSGSYGIYAEMNRQELPVGEKTRITVYRGDRTTFPIATHTPEEMGAFCFPPLAALITAGARLMLATLERCVTDRGGTYAFCDTDSMAIVATEDGGLVPCDNGTDRLPDGTPAIHALLWRQVDAVVERFAALNPYDRSVIPGSVLEIEDENFESVKDDSGKHMRGPRRQLWCYAISAKRYALFTYDADGMPVLVDVKEHGLGHLLNPTDPDSDDRAWIGTIWQGIVYEAHGLPFAWPEWLDRPALTRMTLSSPTLMRPFAAMNVSKAYADQIKPFNFILSAHVDPFGLPVGADPRFHLIARYETDSRQWQRMAWYDVYSGRKYHITTNPERYDPKAVLVKSYRDVMEEYRAHPEAKSAVADGKPCGKQTKGLLHRRLVRVIGQPVYIGKESNRLDDVNAGMVHKWDEVRNEYPDPLNDPWQAVVVPVLKEIPASVLASATGVGERQIRNVRNGGDSPYSAHQSALVRIAVSFAREHLPPPMPRDDLTALAAYLEMRNATKPTIGECPVCRQPFALLTPKQRYCSQQCKKRMARMRSVNMVRDDEPL